MNNENDAWKSYSSRKYIDGDRNYDFREDNVHCMYEDEGDPNCQPAPISVGICRWHQRKYGK